ncbi:MAG: hypothetical protein ABSG41_24375 [Bryobacteraceae bacterium]|jgi:chromosome segregation ATPase
MPDLTDIDHLIQRLSKEHDSLLQQREVVLAEEKKITSRREELDRQISGLQQSLQGLSLYATAGDKPVEATVNYDETIAKLMQRGRGITSGLSPSGERTKTLIECCRTILSHKAGWMSALDVRQALHAARFDFSEYKSNPLSSIHTTLKRIAESEQAWTHHDASAGENLYRWKKTGETAPPPLETRQARPPE